MDSMPSAPHQVALYLGFMPRALEPFASMLICGLISRLHSYQKDLLLYGSYRWQPQGEIYTALLEKRIDGLIFIPPRDDPLTARLAGSGLPVVAIADRAPGIVSVVVDDSMGAFMLAEHLALRGYHHVIFRQDPYEHDSAVIRRDAFLKSAQYLGIEVTLTLPADAQGTLSAAEEALLRAPAPKRPTAVVSWLDTYAYATLRYCKLHNLQVPRDIAVAGFDGITPLIEPARRLTSVQAPWFRVAEKSVDLLIQLARGEEVIRETILPVDLVIGDTT
jgi:DNA-binding LacI/PurR family transcriptional regulator